MANSNTKHSANLRKKTAAEWQQNISFSKNRLEIRSVDSPKISRIKEGLLSVPGNNNADKLLLLLECFSKQSD